VYEERFKEAVHTQDVLGAVLAAQSAEDLDKRLQPLEGHTLLTYAIKYGTETLAQLLMEMGADARTSCAMGNTPVYYAVQNNYADTLRLLFEMGAKPKANTVGMGSLWLAAAHTCNTEIYNLLIENGIDVNTQDTEGWSPLHTTSAHGTIECCKALLQAGADINAQTYIGGMTPLYHSVIRHDKYVCEFLVNAGAGVNIPISTGKTALHSAARKGYKDVCKILIEAGANVDALDGNNDTPLHLASVADHKPICQMLIAAGADVEHKNTNKITPWHRAYGETKTLLENSKPPRGIRHWIYAPLRKLKKTLHIR